MCHLGALELCWSQLKSFISTKVVLCSHQVASWCRGKSWGASFWKKLCNVTFVASAGYWCPSPFLGGSGINYPLILPKVTPLKSFLLLSCGCRHLRCWSISLSPEVIVAIWAFKTWNQFEFGEAAAPPLKMVFTVCHRRTHTVTHTHALLEVIQWPLCVVCEAFAAIFRSIGENDDNHSSNY